MPSISLPPAVRLATPHDAQAALDIYAPIVRNTIISFELTPPSLAEMRQRIEQTLKDYPWLVYVDTEVNAEVDASRVLGYAYASAHRSRAAYQWSVDVSAYVHERARRRGVARSLYEAVFAILARQGFYNAYAGIALPNPASTGFHEAMGFELVGVYRKVGFKRDAWHDVGWWQRPLQERAEMPRPPVALRQIELTSC